MNHLRHQNYKKKQTIHEKNRALKVKHSPLELENMSKLCMEVERNQAN